MSRLLGLFRSLLRYLEATTSAAWKPFCDGFLPYLPSEQHSATSPVIFKNG